MSGSMNTYVQHADSVTAGSSRQLQITETECLQRTTVIIRRDNKRNEDIKVEFSTEQDVVQKQTEGDSGYAAKVLALRRVNKIFILIDSRLPRSLNNAFYLLILKSNHVKYINATAD